MREAEKNFGGKPSQFSGTGPCLICTALKKSQDSHIENLTCRAARWLCNTHIWLVAKLADSGVAADIFLHMLEHPLQSYFDNSECDLCLWTAKFEQTKIEELVRRLADPTFEGWFRQRGDLCLPHARKLLQVTSKEIRAGIILTIQRQTAELKGELIALSQTTTAGRPVHPGLLERVAEFLIAKRGFTLKT
jgi:hypothetical protein